MSAAMTPAQIRAAFTRWHVKYVEVTRGGVPWYSHDRAGHGPWGDLHGQLAHHTGPFGTVVGMVALIWDGRSDLPGPLAHDTIDADGTVYLTSAGRSNHAGTIPANIRDALLASRPLPAPSGAETVDGNSILYGDEIMNSGDGKQPYPNAQVEATVRVHAARAEHHGWDGLASARHGGVTTRKIDTNGSTVHGDAVTQAFWQAEVDHALRLGPDAYTYPATQEAPDMDQGEMVGNSGVAVGVMLQRTYNSSLATAAAVPGLVASVAALTATVGHLATGQGADPDAIKAAAKAGAQEALAGLVLVPEPPAAT